MEANFSLKRLFVCTALVAVGVAVLVRVVQVAGLYHWIVDFPICFMGGAIVGAGILLPFKRAGVGAVIGIVLSMLYLTSILFG